MLTGRSKILVIIPITVLERSYKMAKKEDRFDVTVRDPGGFSGPELRVIVDKKTGVNYLFAASGYAGGLTVLLNRDGTPVVTPVTSYEE